jgi:hypothetical protein
VLLGLIAAACAAPAAPAADVQIPASTRTPPPAAVRAVTGVAGGRRAVTLSPAGGAGIRVGDVLALGLGRRTPAGLMGRVTAVRRSAAGVVLTTVPATLSEAVPRGALGISRRVSATADAGLAPQTMRSLGSCAGVGLGNYGPAATLTARLVLSARWHTPAGSPAARLDTARLTLAGTLRSSIAPCSARHRPVRSTRRSVRRSPSPRSRRTSAAFPS